MRYILITLCLAVLITGPLAGSISGLTDTDDSTANIMVAEDPKPLLDGIDWDEWLLLEGIDWDEWLKLEGIDWDEWLLLEGIDWDEWLKRLFSREQEVT